MLNISYVNKEKLLSKSLVLATMAALLCITFASTAFADAGDRDLDVNAINTAPNLLAPRAMTVQTSSARPAPAHGMKPVHMARVASRHHSYPQARRY